MGLVGGCWLPAVHADLTFQGPSGFVQVPSHQTIHVKQLEFAAHGRMARVRRGTTERALTDVSLGFSPIRDFELGVEKLIDNRLGAGDQDPDPTVNFKVRFANIPGEFANTALGCVLDTNPNNYHTLYVTVGGCGIGWNFGGNPGSGIAHYGKYDRGRKAPQAFTLLLGAELNPGQPGERGYRSHYLVDYNGDVFSLGWRFKSHRGFWCDATVSSKTTYDDFYDYQPLSIGLGGIF